MLRRPIPSFVAILSSILATVAIAACDVSDPYEDACKHQDTLCKDQGSTPAEACNSKQFDQYKNGLDVSGCVSDSKSCLEAVSCYDESHAIKK